MLKFCYYNIQQNMNRYRQVHSESELDFKVSVCTINCIFMETQTVVFCSLSNRITDTTHFTALYSAEEIK